MVLKKERLLNNPPAKEKVINVTFDNYLSDENKNNFENSQETIDQTQTVISSPIKGGVSNDYSPIKKMENDEIENDDNNKVSSLTTKESDDKKDDNEDKKLSFSFMKKRDHLKKCFIANTCGHFSEIKSYGQFCPRCNSFFNFYLPNLNVMDDSNSYYDNIIMRFFANFKKGFKLIKNMIIILDFRSRLKPEIIQDEITYLMYRNLFIIAKLLAPKINLFIFTDRKSKLGTFFFDFIYRNKFDSTNFVDNFFLNYVSKFNYKIDYEFLKRVELIRLFFLSKELEFIVDIDEHFSFKNLIFIEIFHYKIV